MAGREFETVRREERTVTCRGEKNFGILDPRILTFSMPYLLQCCHRTFLKWGIQIIFLIMVFCGLFDAMGTKWG